MDKDLVKISIVLPTYNGAEYIQQSIDGCLNQTYKNIELIIVDDGSSAEISKIIKLYSDKRIKYFQHQRNLGLSKALNTGFLNSKGDYLTWTSDDNFYYPEAIESMITALKRSKVDFVYANYHVIDGDGKRINSVQVSPIRYLDRYNCVGPCFLYKRKVYEVIGLFNTKFPLAQDYEYWLRVRNNFKMEKLNKFLYGYRKHSDSLTSRYKMLEIEKQAAEASDQYIYLGAKYYHRAKVYFYRKEYYDAGKMLVRSLLLDFFHFNAWKLLAIVCLFIFFPSLANRLLKKKE